MKERESSEFLIKHYADLGDQQRDFRNSNLIELIRSSVGGKTVLDIGCGSGTLLSSLAADGRECIGVEPVPELAEMARRRNPSLEVLELEGHKIDELQHKFDTITAIDVIEHIEDDTGQLKKIAQALVDRGQLVIVVPAYQLLYGLRDQAQGHYRRYGRRELSRKVRDAGFEIRSIRSWNFLGVVPYLVAEKILRKPLEVSLRKNVGASKIKNVVRRLLDMWFRYVENRISFGLGLSIICIAVKRTPGRVCG